MRVLLLSLTPRERALGLLVARCLGQAPKTELHFLSRDPEWVVRFSRHVSSFQILRAEEGDDEATVSGIYRNIERTGAQVVLPTGIPSTSFLSANRDILSEFVAVAPSPRPNDFDMVADKWLLTKYLAERELCYPPTVLCTDDEEFDKGIHGLSFPVLLKPRQDRRLGAGIKRFETTKQLQDYLDGEPKPHDQYVVQRFIRGHDVGCNMLCHRGRVLAHTIHRPLTLAPQPFAPAGVIEYVDDEQVFDLCTKLVRALVWSGPANIDLGYDEESGQPNVFEFNPRYWGSLLGGLSAGINFPYLHCLAGLGVEFAQPSYRRQPFANTRVRRTLSLYLAQNRHRGRFTLAQTRLRFHLADPLPATIEFASRNWRAMRRLRRLGGDWKGTRPRTPYGTVG